jgi:DNA-binding NarL/FixJ family response regulator
MHLRGEAEAPAEAIAVITSAAPDVVLLDVHLPDGGGVAVLRALAGAGLDPEPRVLALSVSDAAEDVVPMIRAGALGYVTKTIGTGELAGAIERVAAGDAYFSPRLAAFVLQAFSAPEVAVAPAERARGAPPPRPGLRLQADRSAARDQRTDRRVGRGRGAAQAAADIAP